MTLSLSSQYLHSLLDPYPSATSTTCNSGCRAKVQWSSMTKPVLGMILVAGALTAGQAQAVVVNVNSQDWDVTIFTGSYNTNISKFALPSAGGVMPWWGNNTLAASFASAVSNSFGKPNATYYGPYFGYKKDFITFFGDVIKSATYAPDFGNVYQVQPSLSQTDVWAQATKVSPPPATPVPGPLPALGAAAAFRYSRKLRKRIKSSTNAVSSSYSL